MKSILIPLVSGFEEIEATTCIDVLKRAGLQVVTAGIPGTQISGSKGVKIIADKKLEDINPDEFDVLVLAGGDPGYKNLANSQKILNMILDFNKKGKLIAAIGASPIILAKTGILDDKVATVYPGLERNLPKPRQNKIILDGNVLTAQAPGTAMEFALKIIEVLFDSDKVAELKRELIL